MNKTVTITLVGVSLVGLVVGYWAATVYLPKWFSLAPTGREVVAQPQEEIKEETKTSLPGRIAVQFSQETAQVGEDVTGQIVLDTGGQTINGFDVLLEFDPEEWAALTSQVTPETEIFVAYPVNEVLPDAGTIKLSGLTDLESGFTGEVNLGSFLLRPKKPGKLEVNIVFERAGAGTDTNLAAKDTGEDILGTVENGVIVVEE